MGSLCGSGKATTTSTTSSAPPPEVMEAYRQLMARATGVADTPYQPYTGEQVAPLGQGTLTAADYIQSIGLGQLLTPYLQQAQQYTAQGAAPITGQLPAAANANMNPYAANASQFGIDLGGALSQYGVNQGNTIGNFGTNLGGALSQYGINQGAGVSNFANNLVQNAPQFEAFSPEAVQQYLSPYTQNVVDATTRQFQHDNAVQGNQLLSQGIRAGNAFGGDRMGIAQSELAGTQKRAQDPVIAGLYDRAYSQALGQFNTGNQQAQQAATTGLGGLVSGAQLGLSGQQAGAGLGLGALQSGAQLGLSGQQAGAGIGLQGLGLGAQGYGQAQQLGLAGLASDRSANQTAGSQFGNLGQLALSGNLTGAQAALGASTIPQQQQQQMDTTAYNNWLTQQAYPFATTSFLAENLLGTGSQLGGTSTTNSTQPSPAFSFLRTGGRVPHRAAGGSVPFGGVPWITLKGSPLPMGKGPPQPPSAPHAQQSQPFDLAKGLGNVKAANELYKGASGMFSGVPSPMSGYNPVQDVGNLNYAMGPELPGFYAGAGDGLGALAGAGGAELGAAGVGAELGVGAAELGAGAAGLGAGLGAEMALAGAGIAEALPFLAFLLNRGGAVPRRRYADGGLALPMQQPPMMLPPPAPQAPPADDNGMGSLMRQVEEATTAFRSMRRKAQGGLVMPSSMPLGFADGGLTFDDRYSGIDNYNDVEILPPDQFNRFDANAGFGNFDPPPGTPMTPEIAARTPGLIPDIVRMPDRETLPMRATSYDAPPRSTGVAVRPDDSPSQSGGLGALAAGTSSELRQPGRLPDRQNNALDNFMDSPWFALTAGILGAMASRSPYASVAIGEGALTGLSTYAAGRKLTQDADRVRAQLERQDAQQQETVRHNRSSESYRDRALNETVAVRRDNAEQRSSDRADAIGARAYPGEGVGPDGATVKGIYQYNPDTREYDFKPGKVMTGKPGGDRTGQTEKIIAELRKENPNLTYQEALALTKRAPNGDQTMLRRESLALSAAKADIGYLSNPEATLEKWRKQYGLGAPSASPDAKPAPQGGAAKAAPPEVLSKAKDAIAKGAPREAVIKRLRDAGYSTDGL